MLDTEQELSYLICTDRGRRWPHAFDTSNSTHKSSSMSIEQYSVLFGLLFLFVFGRLIYIKAHFREAQNLPNLVGSCHIVFQPRILYLYIRLTCEKTNPTSDDPANLL